MKRLFKILGLVVGVVVVLLIVAGVAVSLLFDPNDYKDEITAAVQDATGRQLTLDGDLELAVFPTIRIAVGGAARKTHAIAVEYRSRSAGAVSRSDRYRTLLDCCHHMFDSGSQVGVAGSGYGSAWRHCTFAFNDGRRKRVEPLRQPRCPS
jgi:hypothetical protein